MESYEQFYSRTLNALPVPACSTAPRPQRALSAIHFRGKRLLQPLVSEALRGQMAVDRQTAMERDRRRQTQQTEALLQRVQHILNNIQLRKEQKEADSTSETLGPCWAPASQQTLSPSSSLKRETLRLLNQRMETLPSDLEFPESSLCLSLMGSYARLPSPQPSCRPPAGHILISSPVSEIELSPSDTQQSGTNSALTPSPDVSRWNCSDGQLSIITSTPSSTRSDQTQAMSREKPRGARRLTPAPLNRSYDVENPSPSLNRPQVDSEPMRPRLETETPSLQLSIKQLSVTDNTGVEQQIQALEVLRERLEREHTQQISKRRTQHLQQEQTKAFCRLTAVTRGFLTRRLLRTDKIKQLRKTIQDSRHFIQSFQTDSHQKRFSVSHQDLSLYQRVTAQLRLALHDVHQIFSVWPVRDRMSLLQQDREIRRERTLRDMDRDSPGNSRILSSATQKTLDRKTQRQAKKTKVIPWSSPARTLQPHPGHNSACFSQSVVKKRDEGVRQKRSLHRKYLSLG